MKKIFILPMIIVLVLAMGLAGCAGEKEAPEAAFSASPTSGDAPLTVQFTDSSTGEVDDWAWDFGDNSTSTAQSPSHIYDTAGTYTVSLEVTGPGGSDTATRTNYITVTSPDTTPPVISGVSASGITTSTANITWTTDEDATSQVEYGTTTGYGSNTTLDETLGTSHSVSLSGLTAETTYHYRVKSKDAADNEAISGDYTFNTTAEAPTQLLQPGTQWVYNSTFVTVDVDPNDPPLGTEVSPGVWVGGSPASWTGGTSESTTWTYNLTAIGVTEVYDYSPCQPVPPPGVVTNRVEVDHGASQVKPAIPGPWTLPAYSGSTYPWRKPTMSPFNLYYYNTSAYINVAPPAIGEQAYRTIDLVMTGGWNLQEWEYRDYVPVVGNVGIPYIAGNSWTYEVYSNANAFGQTYPGSAPSCLSPWTWNFQADVVATGLTVTVPAGTFTDVVQIDHYVDWNKDGVFDQTGNPLTDELTNRYYWSPTVMNNVQAIDYLTFSGPPDMHTGAGGGSSPGTPGWMPVGPPAEAIETNNLTSYNLIWG